MLEEVKRRTGNLPTELLLDGGYVKDEAFELAAEQGTTVYAPVRQPKNDKRDPHAPLVTDSPTIAEWRARMGTEPAKEIYKDRAATAETVNADLKTFRGLDRLLVRGSAKVLAVVTLGALTYNVLRLLAAGGLG